MNEQNIDAESVTRNKNYDSFDHLCHLLKIGWGPKSQLVRKFIIENNLSERDIQVALSKLKEIDAECCFEREKQ